LLGCSFTGDEKGDASHPALLLPLLLPLVVVTEGWLFGGGRMLLPLLVFVVVSGAVAR
jgi:hypothetical protein